MTGQVTLVLLPALDGTGVFFEPLCEHLPAWVRTVVVRYPEQGPHDYESLCALAEEALRDEPFWYVLGWSFGGPLALMLAARHPSRVRGVILCASFVTSPLRWLKPLRWVLRGPVVGVVRGLWRARFLLPRVGSDRFRAAKGVTWRSVSSSALAARGRAIMRVDVREQLRSLRSPLLYLTGAHDGVVGPRSACEIARCHIGARIEELPGDHYALFSHANHAAQSIAGFLQERESSPHLHSGGRPERAA